MKIQMIRVGTDKGCGGRLSRVFRRGYHFIPIPKHSDPEFCRFTYGEPSRAKAKKLSKLRRGDVLAFYAGFEPVDYEGKPFVGVFCYFVGEKLYLFRETERKAKHKQLALEFAKEDREFDPWSSFDSEATPKCYKELIRKFESWNAHVDEGGQGRHLRRKQGNKTTTTILVCGNRRTNEQLPKSALFNRVLKLKELKNRHYRLTRKEADDWGLIVSKRDDHELNRSPVRELAPNRVGTVWKRLQKFAEA